MATPGGTPNGGSSDGNSGHSAAGHTHFYNGKKDTNGRHQKIISVRIQPTIGPSFALSLPSNTKIATLKDSISDKMGLSPQKMTLLLHNNALASGTLTDNGIEDGNEVRLVPAIESGVTTTNSVDPVAMMKHSMSGISDQQIDDFLNGKFPLSVAIRVGESVVVVNLHRAKVEEIEMEPPPHKRRCVRASRPSIHDDIDYLESSSLSAKHGSLSSRESYQCLNSNHSASDLMSGSELPALSDRRSVHAFSGTKAHQTFIKGRDILSASRRHRKHDSSAPHHSTRPLSQPDRSMLTYTRDVSGAPMETSVAISAPAPMESPSHTPIPRSTPIISKDAPVVAPITPSHSCHVTETKTCHKNHEKTVGMVSCTAEEENMEVSTDNMPKAPCGSARTSSGHHSIATNINSSGNMTSSMETSAATATSMEPCCSGKVKLKSVTRSVQTDPEPGSKDIVEGRGVRAASSPKDRRIMNRREIKLPESGVSMKRKAVMEAISEILKKMYANTEKGRLPGSFKGRFSSEFTCDSDMREILHSKTTMTSYGSEIEDPDKTGSGDGDRSDALAGDGTNLSKAKLEEHQQLKDKVANLKWKMQHKRALRMAKRKGERSPCGWMEALNCVNPGGEPKIIDRTGFCGLKRGFLMAD